MRLHSGLSDLGQKMIFENFLPLGGKSVAKEIAMNWDVESVRGILFSGSPGVGKTHLACAVVNRLIEHGIFAYFLPTVRIPKEDTSAVERLSDPEEIPVLVLDDLGAEKGTERALECLYSIIEGRLWNEAPTFVTTNFGFPKPLSLRLSETKAGYGERFVSRLSKACELVLVGGSDMRIEEET